MKKYKQIVTEVYFVQKGKWAGYWKGIPFNFPASELAKRGHITRTIPNHYSTSV